MMKSGTTVSHRGSFPITVYATSNQDTLATLLLGVFSCLIPLQYLRILPPLLCNGAQLLIGICSLTLCFLVVGKAKLRRYLLFIGVYTAFGIVSFFYNGNADLIELLWPLGYMSAGLLLVFFRPNIKASQSFFYGYCAAILLRITLAGDVDAAGFNASRNMISVHVLALLSIYLISVRKAGERFSVMTFLCAIFLCMISRGRSAVFLAGIFALYLLVCLVFDRKAMRVCGKLDLLFWAVMALIYFYPILRTIQLPKFDPPAPPETTAPEVPGQPELPTQPEIPETPVEPPHLNNTMQQGIENLQARGLRSSRIGIWKDYLEKVGASFTDLLFGAAIGGTPTLDDFTTNLHNSFFMLHAKYGLLGLLLVLVAMVCSGWRYLMQRNIHYLFLMAALFWRMNLDYTNFNGILDILLVFLIFYPVLNQNEPKKKKLPSEKTA